MPGWSDLKVVQSLHRILRVLQVSVNYLILKPPRLSSVSHLRVGELHIGVPSVEAVVVHHQPHLVYLARPGEDRQQLLLEAVPGYPGHVDLAASARRAALPTLRWS